MKAYKIPTGKQWQYYRQYNAFDALLPILMKDGSWVIPEDALNFHEDKYVTNFERSGATQDVRDIVQATVQAVKSLQLIEVTEADQHPIQKLSQQELILDEKTIVENFLKETIPEYRATDTIAQALTKIQAKAEPIKIK